MNLRTIISTALLATVLGSSQADAQARVYSHAGNEVTSSTSGKFIMPDAIDLIDFGDEGSATVYQLGTNQIPFEDYFILVDRQRVQGLLGEEPHSQITALGRIIGEYRTYDDVLGEVVTLYVPPKDKEEFDAWQNAAEKAFSK